MGGEISTPCIINEKILQDAVCPRSVPSAQYKPQHSFDQLPSLSNLTNFSNLHTNLAQCCAYYTFYPEISQSQGATPTNHNHNALHLPVCQVVHNVATSA
jgi:hypothetical protein